MDNKETNQTLKNIKNALTEIVNKAIEAETGINVKLLIKIVKYIALTIIGITLLMCIIISNLYEIIFSSFGFYDATDYVEQFSGTEINTLSQGLIKEYGYFSDPTIDSTIESLFVDEKECVKKDYINLQKLINNKGQVSNNVLDVMKNLDQDKKVELYLNDLPEESVVSNYNSMDFWANTKYRTLFAYIAHNYSSDETVKAIKQSGANHYEGQSWRDTFNSDVVTALTTTTEKIFTQDNDNYKTTYMLADTKGNELGSYTEENGYNYESSSEYGKKCWDNLNAQVQTYKTTYEQAKNEYETAYNKGTSNDSSLAQKKAAYENAEYNYNVAKFLFELNPYGVDQKYYEAHKDEFHNGIGIDTKKGRECRKRAKETLKSYKEAYEKAKNAYEKAAQKTSASKIAKLQDKMIAAEQQYQYALYLQAVNPYGVAVQITEHRDYIFTITLEMHEEMKDLSEGAEYVHSITEQDLGRYDYSTNIQEDGYATEILKEIDAGESGAHGGWGTTTKILAQVTWHKVVKTLEGWVDSIKNFFSGNSSVLKEGYGTGDREHLYGFREHMTDFDQTYSYRTFVVYPDSKFSAFGVNDEADLYAFLRQQGMSHNGACGLLGNLSVESSFNPTAGNENGHYGLVQWGGKRLNNLKSIPSYSTLDTQIAYMMAELTGSGEYGAEDDSKVFAVLKQNGLTTEQCCYYVMANYERCPKSGATGTGSIKVNNETIKTGKWQGENKRLSQAKSYEDTYRDFDWEHHSFSAGSMNESSIKDILKKAGFMTSFSTEYKALYYALSKVGLGYSQKDRLGPLSYDCSGLSYMSYAEQGISMISGGNTDCDALVNWARANGKVVDYKDRKAGDIVVLVRNGDPHHAYIFVGNIDGQNMIVEAADESQGIIYHKEYSTTQQKVVIRPNM